MAYPFAKVEADTIGSISKWDIPINEWMGIKFGAGSTDSIFEAVSRFSEDKAYSSGALLNPKIANDQFGIPGYLQFNEPVDIQEARLRNERKKKELQSMMLMEAASHSAASFKAVAGFGAMLVGNLANPLDLGLAFMPIVGSEKAATGVAKLGGGAFKQTMARGLIAEEAIARSGVTFPRITGAVIDGTVNQAIAEIPIAIQKHRDQAEYTALDFFINIAAGGLFAGAIKAGALTLELKLAGKRWAELDPRVKQAEIVEITRQFIEGERPKGGGYVEIDESIIRAKVEAKFGPAPTRKKARAEANKAFEAKVKETGQVVEINAPEAKVGDVIEGGQWNYRIVEQTEGKTIAQAVDKTETPTVAKNATLDPTLEAIAVKDANGVKLTQEEIELRDKATTPEEIKAYEARVNEIKRNQSFDKAVEEQRAQSIKEFVAKKKAEYQAKLKDEIDAETQAEIQAQISAGRAVTPEQVKKYSFSPKDIEAATAAIEEDAAGLQKTIMDNAVTDEEKAALRADLDELNADLDEKALDVEDAVEPALPCVIGKASK